MPTPTTVSLVTDLRGTRAGCSPGSAEVGVALLGFDQTQGLEFGEPSTIEKVLETEAAHHLDG